MPLQPTTTANNNDFDMISRLFETGLTPEQIANAMLQANSLFSGLTVTKINDTVNNGHVVDTLADLRNMDTPYARVYVTGYHTKGDGAYGSNAFYLKGLATTEIDDGGVTIICTIGDMRYIYELKYSGWLSVKYFGARGNKINDDYLSIQNTIDYAIKNKIRNIYCPDGQYITSDTIQLGYTTYTGLTFTGAGNPYKGEAALGGTSIYPTFKDRPCIVIQSSRLSAINAMALIGQNMNYVQGNGLGTFNAKFLDTDISVWTDVDITTGRYNPYAGIAIDPYCGARPTISYPDVIYPSWTNITQQYNKGASSQIKMNDVSIYGFHVGIVQQPCDYDGNSDFNNFDKVTIRHCAYGYSVGNSQARQLMFSNSLINNCHTAYTTNTHGRKVGKCQGIFFNTNFDCVILIAKIGTAYGTLKFDTVYGEQLYKVLELSSSSNNNPVIFENCELNFGGLMSAYRGVPDYMISGSNTMVMFIGGAIMFAYSDGIFTISNSNSWSINATKSSSERVISKDSDALFWNFTQNGFTPNISSYDILPTYRSFNVDTKLPVSDFYFTTIKQSTVYGRGMTFPSRLKIGRSLYKDWDYTESSYYVNTATWTNIVVNNNNISLNIGTSDRDRIRYKLDVGDVVFFNNTYYKVDTRNGNDITLIGMSNYSINKVLNEPILNNSTGDAVVWHSRKYIIKSGSEYIISFTIDSSTATVSRHDGYNGLLTTDFVIGDRLIIRDDLYGVFAVSDAQKIISVDQVNGTLTFESRARRTISNAIILMMSRTIGS